MYIVYKLKENIMSKEIYTVTTVRFKTVRFKGPLDMDDRCVGFFHGYKNAVLSVVGNYGDIYECGYYPYVVIEELTEGFYPHPKSFQWFKWNSDIKGYDECCIPEELCGENISNFGIG